MRKFVLPIVLLSLAAGTPAYATDWYFVGEGDSDIFFADADSVVRNGDVVSLKLFNGLADGYTDAEKTGDVIYYYEGDSEYNCVSKQFRETSRTGYGDDYQSLGAIGYDSNWQAIPPNSFAHTLYEFGCLGLWRDQPIEDPFDEADFYWFGF